MTLLKDIFTWIAIVAIMLFRPTLEATGAAGLASLLVYQFAKDFFSWRLFWAVWAAVFAWNILKMIFPFVLAWYREARVESISDYIDDEEDGEEYDEIDEEMDELDELEKELEKD